MNEKVLRHKEICDGLNELYARKNHDADVPDWL